MHSLIIGPLLWIFVGISLSFLVYAIWRRQREKRNIAAARFDRALNTGTPFDPMVPGSSLGPAAFGWDDDPSDDIAQAAVEHAYSRFEGQ
jgi:hypothetical protein